jgi:hypothetical protein
MLVPSQQKRLNKTKQKSKIESLVVFWTLAVFPVPYYPSIPAFTWQEPHGEPSTCSACSAWHVLAMHLRR